MNPDVIVIGAGFAGLSAATALAEAGLRVMVVEARPALGGRASTFRDQSTGERVDNGQHILMGCYDETFRFLERVGAADRVRWQDGLTVSMIDRAGHDTVLRLPALPAPLNLAGGVLAWDALSWRDRLSMAAIAGAIGRPIDPGLTVRQWLGSIGQGPRICELFWEPLALAALNQSIDQAAAGHFVGVLARMFRGGASASALVLPAVPLDELYAEPARAWLEARGHQVQVNAKAQIEVEGRQVRAVWVRDQRIEARSVIAAVPWHAFGSLFDSLPPSLAHVAQNAAGLGSLPIVTVNLWLDRPVMREELVGLPGRTFQWVFDKQALLGGDVSHLSLIASGAVEIVSWTNEQLVAAALSELREALPDARQAVLRKASAVRERQATFSLAPDALPRPATDTSVEGLVLAGDWIETGLPATIESAVVSGHRAARLVLGTTKST